MLHTTFIYKEKVILTLLFPNNYYLTPTYYLDKN